MKDKNLPREHLASDPPSDAAASAERVTVSPSSRVPSGIRKIESLRIEPAVELHRSSSGRNIRLKHSKPSAVPSPPGLTPRAPDRKKPQATPPHTSPHSIRDEDDRSSSSPTPIDAAPSPSSTNNNDHNNNQEGSATKARQAGKREDRRSSFVIPQQVLDQLGWFRSGTPEAGTTQPNQSSTTDQQQEIEGKAPASLTQIEEEAGGELQQQQQQQAAKRPDVYQFDLWKKAGRNQRLVGAISGYDSAPSPTKPSPPKPSPPKRRSISADHSSPLRGEHNIYSAARTLATARQGFGRQHHSVDIVRDSSTESSGSELSLTRSTSPIIGGSSSSSRSSLRSLALLRPADDDQDSVIVRWKRGDLIGEGTFGKVFMALNSDTGEFFAMKEIEIRSAATEDQVRQLQKLSEEIELMHNLRHNHIVRYKGSHRTDKYFHIFMEYVPGGSIASMLKKFDAFNEELIRKYTRQIVKGVVYLHEMGIVHRDIKGANVLVSEQGVAKLADFGCSKQLPDIITTSLEESLRSIRGSIPWMAPEVVKQTGHGFKADIWSIGATVIEMATGKHPWPTITNGLAAMYMIATATSSPPIPDHLSPEAKSFLGRCFCIDPDERAAAVDLMEHAFLRKRRDASSGKERFTPSSPRTRVSP